MTGGEYALGAALFAIVYGSAGTAAWLLVRRFHAGLAGAERRLGWALLTTALIVAVHLVPGVLAILDRWTVAAAALIALGIAFALDRRGARSRSASPDAARIADPPADQVGGASSWIIAAIGVALVVVYSLAYLRAQRLVAPGAVDMNSFHMPDVARWIQRGTLWQAPELVPGWAQGHYPHTPELVLLSAVLPWRADPFVRFIFFPFLAMTALGVYVLARRIRVPRPLAALAGALAIAPPTVMRTTLVSTKPDLILWATFAAGIAFLIRHWISGQRNDLAFAGIGLGLAFGSKWSGFSAVIALLVVWGVTWLVARRPIGRGLATLARLGGWIALCGGFWLVRNLVLEGNPLFANKIAIGGVTIFDAPRDHIRETLGFSILSYKTDPGILIHHIVPPVWRAGRLSLILAALGLIVAVALLIRTRRNWTRTDRIVLAGVAAAVALFGAYIATPLSAYGPKGAPDPTLVFVSARYGVTALLVALPVAAWAAAQLVPRVRTAVEVVAVAAIAYGLHESADVSAKDFVVTAVLCAVVLLAARFAIKMPRRLVPAVAGAAALIVFAAGYKQQQAYMKHRFHGDNAIELIENYAPAGYRIGVAGQPALSDTVPVYAMFGPRLRNKVQWVGPLVDGMLQDYKSAGGFRRAVREERYDFIMIQRGSPPKPAVEQQAWLRGTGYRPVGRSRALTLYKRGT